MATEMSAQGSSKVGNFLQQSTAGLPNWAWLLVVAVGVAGAIIVPKFFNKGTSSTAPTTSGMDNTNMGLGLAVDPTTGLPYAVEGLQPSGAFAGGGQTATTTTSPTSTAQTTKSATIRTQFSTLDNSQQSGDEYNNDLKRNGVLVATAPGSFDVAKKTIPFGSTIQITGPLVGVPNTGDHFYPTTEGYVNVKDVILGSGGAGSVGPHVSLWPETFTRSRHLRLG